ncbi:hypothetical protein [Catellatospora paridis]|uniref:hypothetical protein n=1 Tax=Catellatospora paridis TaxID=1617086 RepID=UPI0012D4BEEB|nr:hypothetical protein [Catellatospora paridis]
MTVPLESVPFSELLREPSATADRLSRVRAVRLRRRDADDLVLMTAARAEQEGQVIDMTARLLAEIAHRDPQVIAEVLPRVLPWVRFLPLPAVDEFAQEFVATAGAASALGNMAAVSVLLTAWRHTAEAYSDPDLHTILAGETSGDYGPVPVPEAA